MADEVLKITRHANYAVLTLNRPEKRNALNQPLIEAINNALREVRERQNNSRAAVPWRGRQLLRRYRPQGSR